ncbi:MAG: TIGR01777 family oxidoreductase [Bryobacteraceae bacterium]|nr:TIGR01777 family oxidoreductase [Bryobacteraceae bacterium]
MRIVVTGATGFIGQSLVQRLAADGHDVQILIRKPRTGLPPQIPYAIWDAQQNDPPLAALEGAEAVIHLAGEPVAQRWTAQVKRGIRASRAGGTQRLISALSQLSRYPRVLISGSAIGYYGSRGDEILTEASGPGKGFLAEVCEEWESAANLGLALNMRVVRLRTGLVLGREGGALSRMLPAFRAGLGGRLGSGEQWMSWIHLQDLISLIVHALTNDKLSGAVNGVAPGPVRNSDFTQALARELRRPAIFPAPMFLLRLLFGEMAHEALECSQRVMPAVAEKAGFDFRYTELGPALRDLLRS